MTTTHEPAAEKAETPRHERVGLTNLEIAEKRRRIAEIKWQIAQLRDRVPHIEHALAQPTTAPRKAAALKLEIAQIAFEAATALHEATLLKIDLAENRERFGGK